MKDKVFNIRKLVEEDKIKEALSELLVLTNNNEQDEVILLRSQLTEIDKKERLGLENSDNLNIRRNKIRVSILELVRKIESQKEISLIDLTPVERMKFLLQKPSEWFKDIGNKDYVYHNQFAEFRIEFSEPEEIQEVYSFFYTNNKSFLREAVFKYHSTTLFELECIYVDEMRVIISAPKAKQVVLSNIKNWFYYFDLSSLEGIFHTFLTDGNIEESARGDKCQFLFFKDEFELGNFMGYLKNNEKEFHLLEPDWAATHAKELMIRSKFNAAVSPIFMNKARKMYEIWRRKN